MDARHVQVQHLELDAVLALEGLQDLEPAPTATAPQVVAGVGQPLQLGEHRGGHQHGAVQEAGAHNGQDPSVDGHGGVDDARQRRGRDVAGGEPGPLAEQREHPLPLAHRHLRAEVAEHHHDEPEQRERQVGLRQEEHRPGHTGSEQHAADQAESAGHEGVRRDVPQAGPGDLRGRPRLAAEHPA